MLFAYLPRGNMLQRVQLQEGEAVPPDAIWLDLISPTAAEDKAVEAAFGIAIPSHEEMVEIEPSSRLYIENGARYMTASLLCRADTEHPIIAVVSFILSAGKLVTVRYEDPRPFAQASTRLARNCPANANGEVVIMELLDAVIDRAADVLERVGGEVDLLSRRIFERHGARDDPRQSYQAILSAIGRKGDLDSKIRESLVSIGRLVLFLATEADGLKLGRDQQTLVKSMSRDVTSLTDHASFISNKIQFLLDATLGMVSLEQNKVIKIFAVLSVVLGPPTLVASVYGMNFKYMPELEWQLGYPVSLAIMLAAAVVPFLIFKWLRWL
jgi:magnesium transporter